MTVGRKLKKGREKIISLLLEDPMLSATTVATWIGISSKAVEKHFARLKADGILCRIGPDKGGRWEVIIKN
ncbi:winged helix-turn-helix transcriptional regulator [Butyricimonas faecihominis]